jgi:hypothetical protein
MSTEDQCRSYAAACLDLAGRQPDTTDRARLLFMSEAWLDMADRIARRLEQRVDRVDHPLIERMLR